MLLNPRRQNVIVAVATLVAVFLTINFLFRLGLVPLRGTESLLYSILAIFGGLAFIIYPARKNSERKSVPFYDIALAVIFFCASGYLAIKGYDILLAGWDVIPPPSMQVLSVLIWLMLIEAARRSSEIAFLVLVLLASTYPIYAPALPGMLMGPPGYSITDVAAYHVLGSTSVIGIPLRVVATEVVGFIIFGIVLQKLGGADFFINVALALLGRVRGGSAKVSVVSSAFFGMLSGSVISNVITSGSVTIPAMKRDRIPAPFAGAIEAVASTGGTLMPPVMGAAAFIMAQLMGVSYLTVLIAAVIPSLLFYLGLFVQVDGYAARIGITGMRREELPNLIRTFKEGWVYVISLLVLGWFLFVLRWIPEAPYFATLALLVTANLNPKVRKEFFPRIGQSLVSVGRALSELTVVLACVGFIMGAFFLTGLGSSLAAGVGQLAGSNVFLLLFLAAITSFVLGMGMTVSACYVFVAITIVPILVQLGINEMAANFFALYWGSLSYITPPVALAAIAAAPIAGAGSMQIGVLAARLGFVKYIIPFAFALSPALLLQGEGVVRIAYLVATAALGVVCMGYCFERHMPGIGRLSLPSTLLFAALGAVLFIPHSLTSTVGLVLLVACLALHVLVAHRAKGVVLQGKSS